MKIIICVFLFLLPIFTVPVFTEWYEYPKTLLLIIVTLILIFIQILESIRKKTFSITRGFATVPLLLIAIISVVSMITQSPSIAAALTSPLSVITWVAGFFLYQILLDKQIHSGLERFLNFFCAGSVILAISVILHVFSLYPDAIPLLYSSLLTTIAALVVSGTFAFGRMIECLSQTDNNNRQRLTMGYGFAIIIIGIAVTLSIGLMITKEKPILLPYSDGLSILAGVLKDRRSTVLGIGPSNFSAAFTLTKPVSMNSSPLWDIIFSSSSSFIMTTATETGVIVPFAFLYLIFRTFYSAFIRLSMRKRDWIFPVSTLVAGLSLLLLPGSTLIVILLIVLLAGSSEPRDWISVHFKRFGKLAYLMTIPLVLGTGGLLYLTIRSFGADYWEYQSIQAVRDGRGTDAYNYQWKAILWMPTIDRYHVLFSQTNLALANSLASNKTITPEDQQKIPRLVQQAIDQSRTAVLLNRTNTSNWDNLAQIYASLIHYASGADTWAIQSFQQKKVLNPTSPSVRLQLAILYQAVGKTEESEAEIRDALVLKPDYTEAHYQLALILTNQKKYTEAISELDQVALLVAPGTENARLVEEKKKEIGDLQKGIPPNTSNTSSPVPENSLESTPSASPLDDLPSVVPTLGLAEPTGM